jgi:hypothetical protein
MSKTACAERLTNSSRVIGGCVKPIAILSVTHEIATLDINHKRPWPDEGFVLVLRYVAAMSSKLRAMLTKAWTNCQASQSPNPATTM